MCRILNRFSINGTATPEIYTLSLHDALPIYSQHVTESDVRAMRERVGAPPIKADGEEGGGAPTRSDRKSTRLNSSHGYISYAVFCLKKKKTRWPCSFMLLLV